MKSSGRGPVSRMKNVGKLQYLPVFYRTNTSIPVRFLTYVFSPLDYLLGSTPRTQSPLEFQCHASTRAGQHHL